jgi:hypothetical protein
MSAVRVSATLGAVIALGAACSGSNVKAGDSAATAAPDSAATAQMSPAPAPPPPAVPDSSNKSMSPQPASSAPTSTPAAQPTPSPTPGPSETVLTGKVSVGGLAGQQVTSLQVEGGKPARLVGPLEGELQRLNSATVWVAGAPVATPTNGFAVTRYDIVSIDGAKPLVGVTISRAGAVWLATATDTVQLTTAPSDLTRTVGAKVWVVGRRTGAELTVQTHGIIRDP